MPSLDLGKRNPLLGPYFKDPSGPSPVTPGSHAVGPPTPLQASWAADFPANCPACPLAHALIFSRSTLRRADRTISVLTPRPKWAPRGGWWQVEQCRHSLDLWAECPNTSTFNVGWIPQGGQTAGREPKCQMISRILNLKTSRSSRYYKGQCWKLEHIS